MTLTPDERQQLDSLAHRSRSAPDVVCCVPLELGYVPPFIVEGLPLNGFAHGGSIGHLEFAQHFAGLADEYYTSPTVYEPPSRIVEPWPANVTASTDPVHILPIRT